MPENGIAGGQKQAVEVHLWLAKSDEMDSSSIERFKAWFTPAEQSQFSGFLNERRRHEFIVGHGLARLALARELHDAPECFEFEADAQGKLSIMAPHSARSMHFNISHAADFVVCGTCRAFAIGLDIECLISRVDPWHIAQRFFSEAEANALFALTDSARLDRFFTIWTLKEALAKAHGLGLTAPLDSSRFEIAEDGSIEALSSFAQFQQGAYFAQTSPTHRHRLALCVLCDEAISVQIRVHRSPLYSTEPEGGLKWAEGRLRKLEFQT